MRSKEVTIKTLPTGVITIEPIRGGRITVINKKQKNRFNFKFN